MACSSSALSVTGSRGLCPPWSVSPWQAFPPWLRTRRCPKESSEAGFELDPGEYDLGVAIWDELAAAGSFPSVEVEATAAEPVAGGG